MTIRKRTFILLLFLLPAMTHAQYFTGMGIKGGLVRATQTWDYTFLPSPANWHRSGIDVGIFTELRFEGANVTSILAELHYIQKGMSTAVQDTTQPGTYIAVKTSADYLSIPVLLKFRLEKNRITPFAYVGPRLDILIRKPEAQGSYNIIDFGGSIGGGFEFYSMSPVSISLEARFSPDFSGAYQDDYLTIKNKSLEFLLGVRF